MTDKGRYGRLSAAPSEGERTMYGEVKLEYGTVCGLIDGYEAPKKAAEQPEEVKVEKATEEKPKTAKTAQKRKQTKK